jgi:hypothetical protein
VEVILKLLPAGSGCRQFQCSVGMTGCNNFGPLGTVSKIRNCTSGGKEEPKSTSLREGLQALSERTKCPHHGSDHAYRR